MEDINFVKNNGNTVSKFFHWNTSMMYGSEIVNEEKLSKILVKKTDLYETGVKLRNRLEKKYQTRKTDRNFSVKSMCDIGKFEYILSNSFSVFQEENRFRRPYPSAGALYPVDVYVIINSVEKINSGLYKYNPLLHSLIFKNNLDDFEKISYIFLNQSFTQKEKFSFACIFISNSKKIESKYGNRGYRYTLIEAGHMAENVCLTAEEMQLKAVAVGGFIDYEVNLLLNLDMNYLPLYAIFLGN